MFYYHSNITKLIAGLALAFAALVLWTGSAYGAGTRAPSKSGVCSKLGAASVVAHRGQSVIVKQVVCARIRKARVMGVAYATVPANAVASASVSATSSSTTASGAFTPTPVVGVAAAWQTFRLHSGAHVSKWVRTNGASVPSGKSVKLVVTPSAIVAKLSAAASTAAPASASPSGSDSCSYVATTYSLVAGAVVPKVVTLKVPCSLAALLSRAHAPGGSGTGSGAPTGPSGPLPVAPAPITLPVLTPGQGGPVSAASTPTAVDGGPPSFICHPSAPAIVALVPCTPAAAPPSPDCYLGVCFGSPLQNSTPSTDVSLSTLGIWGAATQGSVMSIHATRDASNPDEFTVSVSDTFDNDIPVNLGFTVAGYSNESGYGGYGLRDTYTPSAQLSFPAGSEQTLSWTTTVTASQPVDTVVVALWNKANTNASGDAIAVFDNGST